MAMAPILLFFYLIDDQLYHSIYLALFVIVTVVFLNIIGHNPVCITFPTVNEELSSMILSWIGTLYYESMEHQDLGYHFHQQHKIIGSQKILFSPDQKLLTGPYEALIGLILDFQENDIEYNKIKCSSIP